MFGRFDGYSFLTTQEAHCHKCASLGGTRIRGPSISNRVLYPLSYRRIHVASRSRVDTGNPTRNSGKGLFARQRAVKRNSKVDNAMINTVATTIRLAQTMRSWRRARREAGRLRVESERKANRVGVLLIAAMSPNTKKGSIRRQRCSEGVTRQVRRDEVGQGAAAAQDREGRGERTKL